MDILEILSTNADSLTVLIIISLLSNLRRLLSLLILLVLKIQAVRGFNGKKEAKIGLRDVFTNNGDEITHTYPMNRVTAPRGSLILWDSRTIHWNQHPRKDRSFNEYPKVRMVGYLCYVLKKRMSDRIKAIRLKAFETVSTGHNPAQFDLKYTHDHIWKEYEQYLEDLSYTQPKINLTPLGKSLLGLDSCD